MKKTHQQPMNIRMTVAAVAAVVLVSSCTTVKEYQKNKLNDSEMTLSARKVEKTEMSFQTYREGASGANGGKTGGGCGCN
jgi:outer membrane murein-binding lipoprotein Lpp